MTSLKLIPKEGVRFVSTIYYEDEPIRDVHLFIFGQRIASTTTIQELEQLEYAGAKRYVLRKLSKRGFASTELKVLLKKYLVSENVIEKVLEECCEKGYIDDQIWIESFIRGLFRRKYGPDAIKQKLLNKGISLSLIENTLYQMDSAEDRQERIKQLLDTRYRNRNLKDFKERQKVIAALMRKGFSLDDIGLALRQIFTKSL